MAIQPKYQGYKNTLNQKYMEVEGKTLRNRGDRDLLILASLIKNQNINKAYFGYEKAVTFF